MQGSKARFCNHPKACHSHRWLPVGVLAGAVGQSTNMCPLHVTWASSNRVTYQEREGQEKLYILYDPALAAVLQPFQSIPLANTERPALALREHFSLEMSQITSHMRWDLSHHWRMESATGTPTFYSGFSQEVVNSLSTLNGKATSGRNTNYTMIPDPLWIQQLRKPRVPSKL